MPTRIKDGHQVATTESTAEQVQELMTALVRQGLNTSLSSLQMWSELARQLGPAVLGSPTDGTMVFRADDYHLFKKLLKKLLTVQHEIVDELIATRCELWQRYLALRQDNTSGIP
jgi:hypothetical protein